MIITGMFCIPTAAQRLKHIVKKCNFTLGYNRPKIASFCTLKKPKNRAYLKVIFIPWYMEIVNEK